MLVDVKWFRGTSTRLFRLRPDDHVLRTPRDPLPAAEAVPDRRDAARAGRFFSERSRGFENKSFNMTRFNCSSVDR